MFLKIIATVVKCIGNRATLTKMLLLESVMYVFRQTTPNILNLMIFVVISY